MTVQSADEITRSHIGHWRDAVGRRIRADAARPADERDPNWVWDPQRFRRQFYRRRPDASPAEVQSLTAAFGDAVRESRGNLARFRKLTADL